MRPWTIIWQSFLSLQNDQNEILDEQAADFLKGTEEGKQLREAMHDDLQEEVSCAWGHFLY